MRLRLFIVLSLVLLNKINYGQSDPLNSKDYQIKIGDKWYNGEDTITRIELKTNTPSEIQYKLDTSNKFKIKNYNWEIVFHKKEKNKKGELYSYTHSDNRNVMATEVNKMQYGDISIFKDIEFIGSKGVPFNLSIFRLYVK
ncbi:MAG: hypothetical protein JWO06_884 [Bacteroidota bacterium]|nr:hypothetical protein [Bacteroidota bacterium]